MPSRPVEASLRDIGPTVAWADALAAEAGLDSDVRYAISVCLEEALANLVLHATTLGGPKAIAVTFEAEPPRSRILVEDSCIPFDSSAPAGTEGAAPAVGGRGLRLLRAFASDVAYARQGERNRLTLSFGTGVAS